MNICTDRKVLRFYGEDIKNFFHRIFTQNFLEPFLIRYSLALTPNGRYLCDFFVFSHEDSFLVDIKSDFVESFTALIDKYKFRSDVNYEVTDYLVEVSIDYIDQSIISVQDPRIENFCYRSIIHNIKNQNDRLIFDFELVSMINCLPTIMEAERSIPIEYNIKKINGIAFGKGCYIGQEFTNRTYTNGVVRKLFSTIIIYSNDDQSNFLIEDAYKFLFENNQIKSITHQETSIVSFLLLIDINFKELNFYRAYFPEKFTKLVESIKNSETIKIGVGLVNVDYLNKHIKVDNCYVYIYSI